jgi:hypothetical protein
MDELEDSAWLADVLLSPLRTSIEFLAFMNDIRAGFPSGNIGHVKPRPVSRYCAVNGITVW